MHPCLNVDEILRLLARELVASGAQATSVALGSCCKSFEDPVLDALWETQDQLTPLLKCFPQDVWEEGHGYFVSLRCRSFSAHVTVWFGSVSRKSQRKESGPISVNMREECES